MALPWALVVLSLLPLLNAKEQLCEFRKAVPITNSTLQQVSGKWVFIAAALRDPQYQKHTRAVKAEFFYMTLNLTEDSLLIRQYQTIGDQCIYHVSSGSIQRQNGTFSRTVHDREHFATLWLTKDPETILFLFFPEDEQKRGLALYARKHEETKEHMLEMHKALFCMGLHDEEILYMDGNKDLCDTLEKEHEEERKNGNMES